MKKLIYILMCAPIIFLSSCSSGGDGPSNDRLLIGNWIMSNIELDGEMGVIDENGNQVLLGDTSMSWDFWQMTENEGFDLPQGVAIHEDGSYNSYLLDPDDLTYEDDTTGTWSATSSMLSIDGNSIGSYSVSSGKLTVNLPTPVNIPDIEPLYITIKNAVVEYGNVDAFVDFE